MWCSQTTAQIQLPSRLAARLILLLLLLLQTRVADGGAACSCALPGIYFIHHTASKHIKHTEIWCVQQLCVRGIYIVKSTRCGHIRFLFSMLNPPSLPPSLSASLPPSLPPSSPLSLSLYDPPPSAQHQNPSIRNQVFGCFRGTWRWTSADGGEIFPPNARDGQPQGESGLLLVRLRLLVVLC